MSTILPSILAIIIGYLLGSIPPAYLLGKWLHGVDIREHGSGNVGGANAGRLFGKEVFAAVAVFDILKGSLSIIIAKLLVPGHVAAVGLFSDKATFIALAGFAAVFGHCYSYIINFSGGKGGATTAGVLLAIDPLTFGIMVLFWVLIVATTRFTSLANLLAIILVPILLNFRTDSPSYMYLGLILIVLIWWRHRENVGRLVRGEERKFGNKEKLSTETEEDTENQSE